MGTPLLHYIEDLEQTEATEDGFRDMLRLAMGALGLNDRGAAVLLDVSRSTVTRWRNGTTTPFPVVRKAVKALLLAMSCRRYNQGYRYVEEVRLCHVGIDDLHFIPPTAPS